jgi:hypothetical protein
VNCYKAAHSKTDKRLAGDIMKRVFVPLVLSALLYGCAAGSPPLDGANQPIAVQGGNDAQGDPIYSGPAPGIGIGIGVGGWSGGNGAGVGIGYGW